MPGESGLPGGIKLFFLAFLGLPMMGVGAMITKFAYMGSVFRYIAGETAPVGKDTFNYMADGTKDSIGDLAQSIGAGLATGMAGQRPQAEQVPCPGCGHTCSADARFCDQCGTVIPGDVRCNACGNLNDPAAKFCDQCGQPAG